MALHELMIAITNKQKRYPYVPEGLVASSTPLRYGCVYMGAPWVSTRGGCVSGSNPASFLRAVHVRAPSRKHDSERTHSATCPVYDILSAVLNELKAMLFTRVVAPSH